MAKVHRYFEDILPKPHYVLRQRLLPLSVGHLLLLHQLESPFVIGGLPKLEDLVSSVLVCKLTWTENLEVIYDQTVKVKGWFGQKSWTVARTSKRLFQINEKDFDFQKECDAFRDYFKSGTRQPTVTPVHGSAEPDKLRDGCPFIQEVWVTLMARCNFTKEKALDCSWSEALWHYYTLKMIDNVVYIENEEEQRLIDQRAKALDELIRSGQLKVGGA